MAIWSGGSIGREQQLTGASTLVQENLLRKQCACGGPQSLSRFSTLVLRFEWHRGGVHECTNFG